MVSESGKKGYKEKSGNLFVLFVGPPLTTAPLAGVTHMRGTSWMIAGSISRYMRRDHVNGYGFLIHAMRSSPVNINQGHPQDHDFGTVPRSCIITKA